jgi:hypothetical protein
VPSHIGQLAVLLYRIFRDEAEPCPWVLHYSP